MTIAEGVALHRAQQSEHVVDEVGVEMRVGALDDVLELLGRSLIHADERRCLLGFHRAPFD